MFEDESVIHIVSILLSTFLTLFTSFVIAHRVSTKWIPKLYNDMTDENKQTWHETFTSIVNSIIMAMWSGYILWTEELRTDVFWEDSYSTRLLSSVEIGYFIADSIFLFSFGMRRRVQFTIHHMFGILGLGMTLVYKVFAFHTCMRIVTDVSSPFMHMRWALEVWNLKHTRLYLVNGMLFVLAYFFSRIATMPLYYMEMWRGVNASSYVLMPFPAKLIYFGTTAILDVLNIYWFVLIVKGTVKLLRKKEKAT